MPFKSNKQRRYLWANEPRIAREWTDRYGAADGGIMRVPLAMGSNGSLRGHPLYGTERPEWFNKQYDFQGTKISSPAEREAINQINTGYLPYMENRKTAQIPYNTGDFDWIDRGKGVDIFPRTEPGSDLSTQMYKDAYGWGEPDKNNYSQEFADLYKQGKYDNLSLAMDDATRYAKGEKTNHEKLTGKNPITDIYDRDYTAGEHYNMTPDAKIKAMRQDLKSVPDHTQRQTNFPILTAQQFANPKQPHTGFEEYDKGENRRMAQEKLNQYPQKKGLGEGITSAWSALKGSPLFSLAAQAFKGQQLTPQQIAMNKQFFQTGNMGRPVGIGTQQNPFQMTSGPFQGMNAPGTSAFGSKTSQEMAQKWMNKYGGIKYTTPRMQKKKKFMKNMATMNQGPASSHAEAQATGGDYHGGQKSTVDGQTTDWGDMSYMIAGGGLAQRAPRGSYLNGGLASLWRR